MSADIRAMTHDEFLEQGARGLDQPDRRIAVLRRTAATLRSIAIVANEGLDERRRHRIALVTGKLALLLDAVAGCMESEAGEAAAGAEAEVIAAEDEGQSRH